MPSIFCCWFNSVLGGERRVHHCGGAGGPGLTAGDASMTGIPPWMLSGVVLLAATSTLAAQPLAMRLELLCGPTGSPAPTGCGRAVTGLSHSQCAMRADKSRGSGGNMGRHGTA